MTRQFYLIAYDVPDDRRRGRVARLLETLGERVQYSLFEAWLTPQEAARLKKDLAALLVAGEDSLRMYFLCAACRQRAETLGQGRLTDPPDVVIV